MKQSLALEVLKLILEDISDNNIARQVPGVRLFYFVCTMILSKPLATAIARFISSRLISCI